MRKRINCYVTVDENEYDTAKEFVNTHCEFGKHSSPNRYVAQHKAYLSRSRTPGYPVGKLFWMDFLGISEIRFDFYGYGDPYKLLAYDKNYDWN